MFGGRTHTQTNRQSEEFVRILDSEFAIYDWKNEFLHLFTVQSVLAPGFFTMASNVVTSSFKDIHPEMARSPDWWSWWWLLWLWRWLSLWRWLPLSLMILVMTIVTLAMIVALTRVVKPIITMVSAGILMIDWSVTLTRRSIVVNTKALLMMIMMTIIVTLTMMLKVEKGWPWWSASPQWSPCKLDYIMLKVEEGVHGDLTQGHSGWDAFANICWTHLSGDHHCGCYFDFDL